VLRPIQVGNSLPFSYPVDPTSTFLQGQIGQLKLIGNDIVVGLSDGTAPLGIIDDIRSTAFSQPVIDEIVIIPGMEVYTDGYNFFNGKDSHQVLKNAGIMQSSFIADYEGLVLNKINGVVTLPAGSMLNWDADGDKKFDSVKTIVNYVYIIPDIPGDDTTIGSNRITIWYARGIYETDQFDTLARYPLNNTLFVNAEGKLTTKQPTADHPGIAFVTGPPSALKGTLEFMWL
jgi:hypothetical protein